MRPRAAPSRRGLTLLELLIAVSITSIAGLALSTVMTTVARSLTGATDARSALQRAHAAAVRLRAFTDPGLCLLQHDPARGFVVWLNDDKPGGTVHLRELRAFWFAADQRTITAERVEFPDAWPEALKDQFNVLISPGSDMLMQVETQRALGYTKTETISDGVLAWSLDHDGATIEGARTFLLSLTMDDATDAPPDVLTAYAFFNHLEPR